MINISEGGFQDGASVSKAFEMRCAALNSTVDSLHDRLYLCYPLGLRSYCFPPFPGLMMAHVRFGNRQPDGVQVCAVRSVAYAKRHSGHTTRYTQDLQLAGSYRNSRIVVYHMHLTRMWGDNSDRCQSYNLVPQSALGGQGAPEKVIARLVMATSNARCMSVLRDHARLLVTNGVEQGARLNGSPRDIASCRGEQENEVKILAKED